MCVINKYLKNDRETDKRNRSTIYHLAHPRKHGLWENGFLQLLASIDFPRFLSFNSYKEPTTRYSTTILCYSAFCNNFQRGGKKNLALKFIIFILLCVFFSFQKLWNIKNSPHLLTVPGERIWYSFYDPMDSDYHP